MEYEIMSSVSVVVDGQSFNLSPGLAHGNALRALANLAPDQTLYFDIDDEIDIPIAPSDLILVRGGERFAVHAGPSAIEDNPCLRTPLRIFMNGAQLDEAHALPRPKLNGSQLRALDPAAAGHFRVVSDIPGLVDEFISDEQRVIVQPTDRFITVPCGNVGDSDIVSTHLCQVQASHGGANLVSVGGSRWLIIPDFELPEGWSLPATTIMVIVPNGYPMTPLDMFYTPPELVLADGGIPNGAANIETHIAKSWRRFSWHYPDPNSWNAARSSFRTHLTFVARRLADLS
jgi:E2/UBC family protein E